MTIEPKVGQVWRVAKVRSGPRFFVISQLIVDLQQARVVTCNKQGRPYPGRKLYGVTTRSFQRGRYVFVRNAAPGGLRAAQG